MPRKRKITITDYDGDDERPRRRGSRSPIERLILLLAAGLIFFLLYKASRPPQVRRVLQPTYQSR